MSDQFTVTPIGVVRGGRTEIYEDNWGGVTATIVLDPAEVEPDATAALEDFSHVDVVFRFHLAVSTRRGAFHPRGNPAWPPVGVLDALDGSPVLDVKPYLREMVPRGEVREPEWVRAIMREYY
jgi:tRNA (Thr-GGU) A37 N-methylase